MDYRTALVTGASSGIGRALSLELARRGLSVVVAARRQDALQQLVAEIEAGGGSARALPLDVADSLATVAAIRGADDDVGGLDLIVANAGVGTQRWAGKLRWEAHVAPLIAVNVAGAAATLTAILPRMADRGRGHLVGISSLAQYRGLPRNAVYSATKAFLSNFLEGLRVDMRGTGVAVTDVRPGFVRTPMTAKNDFSMPFIVEPDRAAQIICKGIDRREPVVEFPWPLATVVRSASMLPPSIYDLAVSRAKG